MKQSSTRGGPAAAALSAAAVPTQRRKGERRPEPVLSEAYAHLSVDGLREYRRALTDEEHRVSYWRRILQARLDVVEAGTGARVVGRRTPGVVTVAPTTLLTRVDLPAPVEPPTTVSSGASRSRSRGSR